MAAFLPDIPVPMASPKVRERNAGRALGTPEGLRCLMCEAPVPDGPRVGFQVDLATNAIMDPAAPDRPNSGFLWAGAGCARKVPAAYRVAAPRPGRAIESGHDASHKDHPDPAKELRRRMAEAKSKGLSLDPSEWDAGDGRLWSLETGDDDNGSPILVLSLLDPDRSLACQAVADAPRRP